MEKEKAEIASLVEKYGRVQSLMKYVNEDTLKVSYSKQPKGKAVGADGVTKEEYGKRLEENIENLIVRMRKFSYKPYPVRRAYIPKGNGKMRGLGIPSFEDKVVQGVFKEILEVFFFCMGFHTVYLWACSRYPVLFVLRMGAVCNGSSPGRDG